MQDSSKQQVCVTKWNYQSYAINNKVTSPLCIFVVYVYISFFKMVPSLSWTCIVQYLAKRCICTLGQKTTRPVSIINCTSKQSHIKRPYQNLKASIYIGIVILFIQKVARNQLPSLYANHCSRINLKLFNNTRRDYYHYFQ